MMRHPWHWGIVAAMAASAIGGVRVAAAADQRVALIWNAPAGCPTAQAVQDEVDRILTTQDPSRCSDLLARLARNHTWQVPTLVELRAMAMLDDDRFTADPRVRYMPAEITRSWNWREDFRLRSRTPEDWSNAKRLYRRNLEIVGLMHRAGVPLLAGTDVLNPFAFPGFSLHDELALLSLADKPDEVVEIIREAHAGNGFTP